MSERQRASVPDDQAPPSPEPVPDLAAAPITPRTLRLIVDSELAIIYQRAQRFLVRALAGISIAFGAALLIGGAQRFDAATPTFAYAATVPGSYRTWGGAALAVGGFTLAASFRWHRHHVMYGLLAQCVLFAFFAVSIAVSASEDPTTPFTGIVIYGGYSLICTIAYVAGHELRKAQA